MLFARRIMTAAAVVFFAFATGYVMQSSESLGGRTPVKGVTALQAGSAPQAAAPKAARGPVMRSTLPDLPVRAIPEDNVSPEAPVEMGLVRAGFGRI